MPLRDSLQIRRPTHQRSNARSGQLSDLRRGWHRREQCDHPAISECPGSDARRGRCSAPAHAKGARPTQPSITFGGRACCRGASSSIHTSTESYADDVGRPGTRFGSERTEYFVRRRRGHSWRISGHVRVVFSDQGHGIRDRLCGMGRRCAGGNWRKNSRS